MLKTSLKPMFYILGQLKEYYPIIVIYSVCISILTLATPISVQSLVNTFSFGPYFQPIFILSLVLLVLLITLGIARSLQYLVVEYLQRKLYAKITANISRAYILGESEDSSSIDDKANRYFDVILLHKNLAFLVTDGIAMALQAVFGLILVSLYHPFFGVFGILVLFAIVLPVYMFGRASLETAVDESTSKYVVADHLQKSALQADSGTIEEKINKTDHFISLFLKHRAIHFRTIFVQNVIYVSLNAILNALLLALGGYLVISNQLSVGQLVAAEIVVNAILSHFLYAHKYLETFYDLHAASSKIEVFHQFIRDHKALTELEPKAKNPIYSFKLSQFQNRLSSIQNIYTPKNFKTTFRNFVSVAFILATTLFVLPWQQFSSGNGRVLAFNPNDRVQKITATVDGVVEEWLVKDGQFVKKGDPIVRVVDNDPNYLIRLESRRDAAIAKFEAAREASDTARLNFHRQEKLVKEGLSSSKDFEQAKIQYKKLRADEATAAAALAKAEVDLARQQQQVVSAPRNGQILRILKGSGTTNVKMGEALVDFVPQSKDNAVELFLDGNDLPLVFPGRKVRLQFEGWPAIQFSGWPSIAIGSFGGVVTSVDPSVSRQGIFRVLVKPDPQDPYKWPNRQVLRQGNRATGIVLLGRVSAGYELWRKVNGFPKSLDGAPTPLFELEVQK